MFPTIFSDLFNSFYFVKPCFIILHYIAIIHYFLIHLSKFNSSAVNCFLLMSILILQKSFFCFTTSFYIYPNESLKRLKNKDSNFYLSLFLSSNFRNLCTLFFCTSVFSYIDNLSTTIYPPSLKSFTETLLPYLLSLKSQTPQSTLCSISTE